MRLLALALASAAATAVSADGRLLRAGTAAAREAPEDADGGSHVPTMVPRGHFAENAYQAKLAALHEGQPHYAPALVPKGFFNHSEEAIEMPKEMPEEMPNMVPPGHFAKVARAQRDAKLSKTFGTVQTQKEGACEVLDQVLKMGRFVYEAETTLESGIAGSGKAIAAMVDIVCPLIGTRFPDAARCMPGCDAMKERITKLYDSKYIGEVKTPRQKCEGKPGRKVNFALLAALTGSDLLFGTDFCEPCFEEAPRCDAHAAAVEEAAAATGAAAAAEEEANQAAEEAASKKAEREVLRAENLKWVRHQIKPLDESLDKSRLPVDPPMDAGAVESWRDAKLKLQLQKEQEEVSPGEYKMSKDGPPVTDTEAADINVKRGAK